jgi:hypothetical protein
MKSDLAGSRVLSALLSAGPTGHAMIRRGPGGLPLGAHPMQCLRRLLRDHCAAAHGSFESLGDE